LDKNSGVGRKLARFQKSRPVRRKEIMDIENPITALLLFTTIAQTSPDADEVQEYAEQAQVIIDTYNLDEDVISSTSALSKKLIEQHEKKFFIEVHLGDGSKALVGCDDQETLKNGLVKFQTEYPGSVQISFQEAYPSLWNAIAEERT
jgi:hypothetical protein